MQTGATLDITQTYRYTLWRNWDPHLPRVGFVMLNPSRADAIVPDPTLRRCIRFAQQWGYGGLEVMNLFAYRSASPAQLKQVADPIGAETDRYLATLPQQVERIIVAWGNHGSWQNRDRQVLALFPPHPPLYCLGITQQGQPTHPLYIKYDQQPRRFEV
jgi:hypothetical protein